MIKTYSEMITMQTFEERFNYLKLDSAVGKQTFGGQRYLNQLLYKSVEWKNLRREIIIRDNGNDLACDGFEIFCKIIVHHLNPITIDDVRRQTPLVFDPENLITTTLNTHSAIHYGNDNPLIIAPVERTKNDTCPWL